jgi:1-acyl-sn-glycerol-3-phosphate acyltransferase
MSIASELSSAILTIWAYLVIAVITILAFPVLLVLFIVLYPFDKKRNVVGRLFRLISVASTKLNPLWSFRVVGKIPPPPTRTICVSNHLSFSDTALISHLPWEMKWLSKRSIFYIPFVGYHSILFLF